MNNEPLRLMPRSTRQTLEHYAAEAALARVAKLHPETRAEVEHIRTQDDDPGYAWEPCVNHPEREALWRLAACEEHPLDGALLCGECIEAEPVRYWRRLFA